ncbi:MAG TPA: dihydroorotase [Rhodocyclaceae bacterium]|nr:MAG: dihydroorotase [Candidatus Omnitrophica bacterium CG1_02_46_14]HCX32495.1 dihydroorotase [Rhodocyclaceae bacterium]
MKILIKNGHVVDPKNKIDGSMDVLIEDQKIKKVAKVISEKVDKEINAKGKVVCPGLIDVHVHLRQPGYEYKETIETGLRAALKGGFTGVCPMPNTNPIADRRSDIEFLIGEAKRLKLARIWPVGAVTLKEEGKELTEFGELKKGGAVALSDDGRSIQDSNILRRACEYSKKFDLVIMVHCEDQGLFCDGCMNEGFVSTRLGLPGIPVESESVEAARDIQLADLTGARLHFCHISSKKSLDLIRQAKIQGSKVTAETCPHYFHLTEESVLHYNTNAKMNPPLRTQEDVDAIKRSLKDGTLDIISTDHAPHAESEKDAEFDKAPFGIIGLETSLALSLRLVEEKVLSLTDLIIKMSQKPAEILRIDRGHLSLGAPADVTIFDPSVEWTVEKEKLESKSKNSPFLGWKMKGKATDVVVDGRLVLKDGEILK